MESFLKAITIRKHVAGVSLLTPVILTAHEAEIRRTDVHG
jgi:hypothetical protein